MNIGIIREGKEPPDSRVPLTPKQCRLLQDKYSNLDISVQSSSHRCFSDEEYVAESISIIESVQHCDILFGVKEVPVNDLIDDKTYLFFSHTIKEQPYNRELLQTVLKKNIRLIDYECLIDDMEIHRLVK